MNTASFRVTIVSGPQLSMCQVTIYDLQHFQFAVGWVECDVCSLLVSDVQWTYSMTAQCLANKEGPPAMQQKLEKRQFSGHHISTVGNKNHPSSSELVRHRFSAFWLRSSVVSVLISLISDTLLIEQLIY